MPLTFDPSGDWRYVDGVEPVTIFPRQQGRGLGGPVGCRAVRLPADHAEADEGGGLLAGVDGVWLVFGPSLPAGAAPPKAEDVVRDAAGKRWSLLRVTERPVLKEYRCPCKREVG